MTKFRLIIACNVVCIVSMLLSYDRFLESEFYDYIKSKKYRIFSLLDITFCLYVLGYISLLKSISDIHMRYTTYTRNFNILLGYYILQMSVNFSFFLSFYELHMPILTSVINTFSLYVIIYFIYLWRTMIGTSYIYLLFYFVTSYISSLLISYIMRLKLDDDYRKKKYMYGYNIIT
ncbi:18 kDa translocator protein [Finch poxvirus]|uniref:18 kDa translocator protein n=2 Tax=unclassified Avipoxvirus TaxID=336487 RepID=A0AAT9UQV2_9POXV|nr:18 kDa translocator protein [Finch poxvirus]UOX39051.1 18 kDa translocator protein [Finch poxvirus]